MEHTETFGNSSIWKIGDFTFDILYYDEKSRKVHIEKQDRFGIYYTDIKTTHITRKLSKDGFIRLEGYKHDLKSLQGLNHE